VVKPFASPPLLLVVDFALDRPFGGGGFLGALAECG
jgi:hypothetical protein